MNPNLSKEQFLHSLHLVGNQDFDNSSALSRVLHDHSYAKLDVSSASRTLKWSPRDGESGFNTEKRKTDAKDSGSSRDLFQKSCFNPSFVSPEPVQPASCQQEDILRELFPHSKYKYFSYEANIHENQDGGSFSQHSSNFKEFCEGTKGSYYTKPKPSNILTRSKERFTCKKLWDSFLVSVTDCICLGCKSKFCGTCTFCTKGALWLCSNSRRKCVLSKQDQSRASTLSEKSGGIYYSNMKELQLLTSEEYCQSISMRSKVKLKTTFKPQNREKLKYKELSSKRKLIDSTELKINVKTKFDVVDQSSEKYRSKESDHSAPVSLSNGARYEVLPSCSRERKRTNSSSGYDSYTTNGSLSPLYH